MWHFSVFCNFIVFLCLTLTLTRLAIIKNTNILGDIKQYTIVYLYITILLTTGLQINANQYTKIILIQFQQQQISEYVLFYERNRLPVVRVPFVVNSLYVPEQSFAVFVRNFLKLFSLVAFNEVEIVFPLNVNLVLNGVFKIYEIMGEILVLRLRENENNVPVRTVVGPRNAFLNQEEE
ncbi:Hypothetical_protein [Hexamita inflata]|uniref:Hypothetical_protein n=1 Tax=Hexamita inflata TaxID=28002 RepID=A0AA86UZS0_9EUKA|nr:Hypothetical protein HINF_LOCUS58381 [Hexamita inflata]